jgi:dCMP deaminase
MNKVPSWDEYFIEIAKAVSLRSKDPSTKVGSVLVNSDNHIIGTGYNGFPAGIDESEALWEATFKHKIVLHSELNCISHAIYPPKNSTLYTTMYPCQECAKLIAAVGIKRVVYRDNKYANDISKDIFERCKIEIVRIGSN